MRIMGPKRFTRDQIDRITYHISSLEQGERKLVREAIYKRLYVGDGMIGQEELHLVLLKLRKDHKISELDMKNVEHAFFEE